VRLPNLFHDLAEVVGRRRLQRRELLVRLQFLEPQQLAEWHDAKSVVHKGCARSSQCTAKVQKRLRIVRSNVLLEGITFDVLDKREVEGLERLKPTGSAALRHRVVDKPSWGAPKIRERLARLYPDVHTPAISTVHAVLDRHGLVKRRTRRRNRAEGTTLSRPARPNELWCADYKGEFMLADRRYCYPLTITDFASRYLIACEALATTKEACAFSVFESVFKEFGLPRAIAPITAFPLPAPMPCSD
jgi:hypothetical protein